MNPRTLSREELKNGFEEGTLEELDDLAKQATGQSMYSPPVDTVVNERRKKQVVLKLCQRCTLACKKYMVPGLTNFECFEFTKEKKECTELMSQGFMSCSKSRSMGSTRR